MVEQTVAETIDDLGFGWFNWKVLLVVGMVWLMEGIEVTLISLVAPRLQCKWNITKTETAILSSSVFIGMGIGAVLWGWLADKYGRKRTLIISSIFVLVFGLLSATANYFFAFAVLRLLVGIGVGGIGSAICYLVEFSTSNNRARAVIAAQFFFASGNLFAALMSYIAMNSLGWKIFLILCATPIPFTIAALPCLPESVRFLQNTGDTVKVKQILNDIAKTNRAPMPEDLDIIDTEDSKERGSLKTLLNKNYFLELFVLTVLWIMSWWSYFGIIFLNTKGLQQQFYPKHNTTVVKSLPTSKCHLVDNDDYLQNTIVVLGEFPGLIFFMLVIERLGRKKCLMLAYFVTSICFFILAFPISFNVSTGVMFCARAASSTLPQILYAFTTELFPTTIRNSALGFCFGIARAFLAALPFLINILVGASHVVLVVFLGFFTFGCTFLVNTLHETTGMTLLNS